MAIEGLIKELSLFDLFQLLSLSQKSGILNVVNIEEGVLVFFRKGFVSFAIDKRVEESLKELFQRKGNEEFRWRNAEPESVVKTLELVGSCFGSQEQTRRFLEPLVEESVYRLFKWKEGKFSFVEEAETGLFDSNAPGLAIRAENLIMEGSRRIDEWSRIAQKIPSLDMVLSLNPSDEIRRELALKPEEWAILAQVDGKRTCGEIVELLGGKELEIGKILYGLVVTGLVKVEERRGTEIERYNALRLSAEISFESGNFERAVWEFSKALEIVEKSNNNILCGEICFQMGSAHYKMGMFEAAISDFERAVSWNSELVASHYYLGFCAVKRGNIERAINEWKIYLEKMKEKDIENRKEIEQIIELGKSLSNELKHSYELPLRLFSIGGQDEKCA